ncbi:MAG: hypothetical protein ACXQS1_02635 [Methermicoccaceae archaeon]
MSMNTIPVDVKESLYEALGEVGVDYTPIATTSDELVDRLQSFLLEALAEDEAESVSAYTHDLERSGVERVGDIIFAHCEGSCFSTPQNEVVECIERLITRDGVRALFSTRHASGMVCAGLCDVMRSLVEEVEA